MTELDWSSAHCDLGRSLHGAQIEPIPLFSSDSVLAQKLRLAVERAETAIVPVEASYGSALAAVRLLGFAPHPERDWGLNE